MGLCVLTGWWVVRYMAMELTAAEIREWEVRDGYPVLVAQDAYGADYMLWAPKPTTLDLYVWVSGFLVAFARAEARGSLRPSTPGGVTRFRSWPISSGVPLGVEPRFVVAKVLDSVANVSPTVDVSQFHSNQAAAAAWTAECTEGEVRRLVDSGFVDEVLAHHVERRLQAC